MVDLANIPSSVDFSEEAEQMAERIMELHKEVVDNLTQAAAAYKDNADSHRWAKQFDVGDLVMVHLQKSHFPKGTYNKLQDKKIGPFEILKKYGDNAFQINLPKNLRIHPIFKISNIFEYKAPDTFQLDD